MNTNTEQNSTRASASTDRFNAKWTPEPNSGCWLWTANLYPQGYGAFHVNGRKIGAHRFAWILFKGEIPEGVQVLHHCDTPACVNPAHLFLGTNADNIRDRNRKGRGTAKLTPAQVKEIRLSSETGSSLAKRFGVRKATINMARNKTNWKLI